MTDVEMVRQRLVHQRIAGAPATGPAAVAATFGALQAQDGWGVMWALGLRCGATQAEVAAALGAGEVVRTWLNRGTLHVAAAADVRWMLALLAPRVIAASARRYRQLELDDATVAQALDVVTEALADGPPLSRNELRDALAAAGLPATSAHGYHVVRRAALEGLVRFGPMRGRTETYTLLAPGDGAPEPVGEAALAELARRYVGSHGPATLEDFVWWSGLTLTDARTALAAAAPEVVAEAVDETTYWQPQDSAPVRERRPTAYLLPAFDEYYLGYRAREAVLADAQAQDVVSVNGVFRPMIVLDGRVVGIWRVARKRRAVTVTLAPFAPLDDAAQAAVAEAVAAYERFVELPVTVEVEGDGLWRR